MHLCLIRPATINNPLYPWLMCFWGAIEQGFFPEEMKSWMPWLAMAFCKLFAGAWSIPVYHRAGGVLLLFGTGYLLVNQRRLFFLCLMMGVFMLAAAMVKAYPLAGRMLLFVRPILLLGFSAGCVCLIGLSGRAVGKPFAMILGALLIGFVFRNYAVLSFRSFAQPVEVQEIKPVLEHLQKSRNASQNIYIYYWAEPAFRFYAADYGFDFSAFQLLEGHPDRPFVYEVCYARGRRETKHPRNLTAKFLLGTCFDPERILKEMQRNRMLDEGCWMITAHMSNEDYDLLKLGLSRYDTWVADEYRACGAGLLGLTPYDTDIGRVPLDARDRGRSQ